MDNPYLSYRIKWACFFISMFIPAVAVGISSAGVTGFMAMLIMPLLLFLIIGTIICTVVWVFWQVISVLWYMMKQICQAISDKIPLARNGKTTSAKRLHKAPGAKLLLMVNFFYSPRIVEQVFGPLVADWRKEYFAALHHGKKWKARWINVRYVVSFVMAMGLTKAFSVIRSIARR